MQICHFVHNVTRLTHVRIYVQTIDHKKSLCGLPLSDGGMHIHTQTFMAWLLPTQLMCRYVYVYVQFT